MRAAMIMFGLLLISGARAAEVAIDRILPPVSELGSAWTSNRVVLLIDPLSSPSEVADASDMSDPEAVLRRLVGVTSRYLTIRFVIVSTTCRNRAPNAASSDARRRPIRLTRRLGWRTPDCEGCRRKVNCQMSRCDPGASAAD